MMRRATGTALFLLATLHAHSAMPGTPVDVEALALLAQAETEQGTANFANAAASLEEFAARVPGIVANDALVRAATIRIYLDQDAQAEEDSAMIERSSQDGWPSSVVTIALARAQRDADRGDWESVRSSLLAVIQRTSASVPGELLAVAHARLGTAYVALGRPRDATAEYTRTLALGRAGAAQTWGDTGRDAFAQAQFFSAEEFRAARAGVSLPPYRGPTMATPIREYQETASAWVARERRTIYDAQRAYLRVLGIESAPLPQESSASTPRRGMILVDVNRDALLVLAQNELLRAEPNVTAPPSPRWAIAAFARIGEMWGDLYSTVRSFPEWPPPPRTFEEFRHVWIHRFDDSPTPDELVWLQAKIAFQTCVQLARRYYIANEHGHTCESWLIQHLPVSYHALDEFTPRMQTASTSISFMPLAMVTRAK